MNPASREVLPNDNGLRPAAPPDECFYCHQKIGQQHKPKCAAVNRTVILRFTVEYVELVPDWWTGEDIEQHRNHSSYCLNNVIYCLQGVEERTDLCLCGRAKVEYVREATAEDQELEKIDVEKSRTQSEAHLAASTHIREIFEKLKVKPTWQPAPTSAKSLKRVRKANDDQHYD